MAPWVLSRRALFALLEYSPHEGQILMHRSKARRRVLACGTRWGKSRAASMEACAALLAPAESSLGWLVAPTYDLVNRIFIPVADAFSRKLKHRIIELDLRAQRIVIANLGGGRSELKGKSTDQPVSLLGEAVDWMVVDEAAKMRRDVWDRYLSPRLIDRRGWFLLISTPNGPGWFWEEYHRGQRNRDSECESWSSPSWTNPYVEREAIEAEKSRMDGETFRQEYGGEFLGVDAEPCEACSPRSPKACMVLVFFEKEELRRCPECNDPVDEEGRCLVPEGSRWVKLIMLAGEGLAPEDGPAEPSLDAAVRIP